MALGLLTAPLAVEAQQPGGMPRIGRLSFSGGPTGLDEALREALRELGWIEGRNLAFEYRFAGGRRDRRPALAEELVRSKVDLIVTSTWYVGLAARDATRTIPIVMASAAEAVENGVVATIAGIRRHWHPSRCPPGSHDHAIEPRRPTPNAHWQAKVRQTLQLYFKSADRGVWSLA